MKYVKILGLLAVAAAALMGFVGTASADYVTGTTGGSTPALNSIKIHAENEKGHVKLANAIATIECTSTVEGTVESHAGGTSGGAAEGKISVLNWPTCTNSWHVTTEAKGRLWIDWTSGHNGTLVSDDTLVKTTRFLVPCNYETNHTHIGTVTGGNPATLHIEASIPIAAGSSELCGSGNAKWEGNYVTTSQLYVVNS